ncbi:acetyl-CoA carboxylase biotin carboxyl carrier protein [Sphingosinicella sp.]|uniref:acetyl-CoA carboxylase biotin carboxyl carrier protein n=1 Tax=Sphingosinicella sp. TaxID=1917971 RepID=UPI004037E139
MSDENDDTNGMRVDADLIRQLANMLSENDLSEIEVEDCGRRIVVKRKLNVVASAPLAAAPAAAVTAAPAPAAEPAAPAESGGEPVRSPMVGTVFLSAEPGAAPFVAAGQQVKAGETLLIIEAMKVMNPITAPRAGTVTRVCVADAQPVEFDQTLVLID